MRLGDQRAVRPPTCDTTNTGWSEFWAEQTLDDIKDLMPDQLRNMDAFDGSMSALSLSELFHGEHVFMVSCWACLMSDAVDRFGLESAQDLFMRRPAALRRKLAQDEEEHGEDCPACFYTLLREHVKQCD